MLSSVPVGVAAYRSHWHYTLLRALDYMRNPESSGFLKVGSCNQCEQFDQDKQLSLPHLDRQYTSPGWLKYRHWPEGLRVCAADDGDQSFGNGNDRIGVHRVLAAPELMRTAVAEYDARWGEEG